MERIALFSKVTFEEYRKALRTIEEEKARKIYDAIRKPIRATAGSGGYDFFLPYYIKINPGESALIPTGIHVKISDGWTLDIYPRSSLGFKHHIQLANTVGIIDADYFGAKNEGHIFIKIVNCGEKSVELSAGDRFAQGKFVPYGITLDDDVSEVRVGGMGSTGQ